MLSLGRSARSGASLRLEPGREPANRRGRNFAAAAAGLITLGLGAFFPRLPHPRRRGFT